MSDLSESAPVYVISKLLASPNRAERALADDLCKFLLVVLEGESERVGRSRALERAAKKQMPVFRDKRALCFWNRSRFLRLGDSAQSQRDLTRDVRFVCAATAQVSAS